MASALDLAGTGDQDQLTVPLYEHVKRKEWGLAILAWEGPDTRRYQFQDGSLRTFKEGYYRLLKEVDRPLGVAAQVAGELGAKLDLSRARREVIAEVEEKGRSVMTMADQIAVFEHLYPSGFVGEKWARDVRGEDVPRRLKKHRAPVLAEAAERLSVEVLDAAIAEGRFEEVRTAAYEIAKGTSLVPSSKDLAPLSELAGDAVEGFARALRDLLHGDASLVERFAAWLTALGGSPSWVLATIFLALVHPAEHVVVRPSSFRQQATWMAPRLRGAGDPDLATYERFRAMALNVHRELLKAERQPRDLVDVHDFIWVTMRPSARKLRDELRAA